MAPIVLYFLLLTRFFQNAAARSAVTPASFHLLQAQKQQQQRQHLRRRDVAIDYPAYNFSVPIDHFHNDTLYEPHSNGTFDLRYWFDASYYKPGGPVIALMSGETSGTDRLPYLQKGIVYQLAKATNGIGVILEHRYYGTSFPTPNISTENLRFLTTDQALADTAYFAKHIEFPGVNATLSSPAAPWIVYGGSYAGAFVAFLRKLYPDVFWGAISSSGVPEAIYDYWQYYEAVRLYGPQDCVSMTQRVTRVVDGILIGKNETKLVQQLKYVFGMANLTYNDDFASTLSNGITGWQGRNWDPDVNDPSFSYYCGNITSNATLFPETLNLESQVNILIEAAGVNVTESLTRGVLNTIGYYNASLIDPCLKGNQTLDQCFTSHNTTFYHQEGFDQQSWRSWAYQYCTQWGYLQVGSTIPKDIPSVISRTIDLEYASIVCREAFGIYKPSNVTAINKYGGFNISYPRLAFIDGEVDPWRWAGVHAPQLPVRQSTKSEPFILIKDAVHHWDENGLFPNETTTTLPPQPIKDTQMKERVFVLGWLDEWRQQKSRNTKGSYLRRNPF